jgi:hypothetical protein
MLLVTCSAFLQLSSLALDPGSTSLSLNNEGCNFQFLSGLCKSFLVEFEVLTAVSMKMTVFWVVAQCRMV